jgi:hypothetical protein
MPEKVVKLNLRLPGGLHRRLQKEAELNHVSLNTEIINQLEGHRSATAKLVKEIAEQAAETASTIVAERMGTFYQAKK